MRCTNLTERLIAGGIPSQGARATGFSRLAFAILLSLLLTILLPNGLYAQSYTLEDILSTPFPSSLIVSPKVDRVAWVFDICGMRNIWVAEGPDYKARQLTDYDQDDGQEMGELSFSPDGSVIVYVRGGNTNRQGEYPNPTSDPRGAEQAVYAIKVSDGKPWRLGRGNHPVVSPAGDQVVFTYRGQLFIAPLDGSGKAKPLFEGRGRNGSQRWSPDGSRLAFVSQRDDHSFIGIYDLKAETITWLMPDVERDDNPVWSPDGRSIACIRFPGRTADDSYGRELGFPFAIWVVDVETGKGREVWKCPNDSGGFAQYYPDHPFMWAAEDRLLFYSEHEGWMHIYSVSAKGGEALCLTPGECEAEHAALSADRRSLIFNSNCGDIDRRHLWTVPVTGGEAKPLTTGKGNEWSPVAPASGKSIVLICSTASQPAAPAMIPING
ncbi:MAG: DPP IV N-terminal domain-containing protein, partial [Acidobacteriota bacterium]